MENRVVTVAVVGAMALAGTGIATYQFGHEMAGSNATVTVAAPAPVSASVPAPLGPPLAAGDYNFNIKGGASMPVHLQDCGDACLMLSALPSAENPAGFSQELRITPANRFSGQSMSAKGIVCAIDHRPRAAEVRYSVRPDGTDGLVEVLDQPCGADAPSVPLAFNLTPVPPA